MILCTLLITACGGKKTQVENDNAVSDSITERQQYRFECQFIKADDGNYDSIVVKGYKDGEVAFECHHELVDYVSFPWKLYQRTGRRIVCRLCLDSPAEV